MCIRDRYTGADYINSIPENYFSDYLKRVEAHVENKKGNLHAAKSTEWSRLILPMTAMGYDCLLSTSMMILTASQTKMC